MLIQLKKTLATPNARQVVSAIHSSLPPPRSHDRTGKEKIGYRRQPQCFLSFLDPWDH